MPEVARRDHASTEQLSALLDNRAEPAELPFLTDHIVTCEACQHELNGLRAVRDLLHRLPVQLPPRAFTIAPAHPAPRFRRLVPVTRVLSALAAVFCVLLFSIDAIGVAPTSSTLPRLQSTLRSDGTAKPADSAQSVARSQPTGTAPPAAAAKPAEPALAARPAPPTAAAPPPPPATTAFSPSASAPSAASSGSTGRSADAPLAVPSGAGAAPPATVPPAAPVPPAPAAESLATATSMATVTPNPLPTIQPVTAPAASSSQNALWLGLSPLRIASFVLGLLAIGLFIGSMMLKRVALAPLDVRPDGLDR